jgi:hypothetical protein
LTNRISSYYQIPVLVEILQDFQLETGWVETVDRFRYYFCLIKCNLVEKEVLI